MYGQIPISERKFSTRLNKTLPLICKLIYLWIISQLIIIEINLLKFTMCWSLNSNIIQIAKNYTILDLCLLNKDILEKILYF
jgi:hypothetical protein